jgi:hypothetical protein
MVMSPEQPDDRPGAPPMNHPFLGWDMADEVIRRHIVGLEPRQAWRLKGLGGAADEIVIPGILLDDFGRTTPAEATLAYTVFCQMQALAAMAEVRMIEARAQQRPRRTRAEANIWLIDGIRRGRRIEVLAVVSLDRLVFAPDRHLRTDTLAVSQIVPGEKAAR